VLQRTELKNAPGWKAILVQRVLPPGAESGKHTQSGNEIVYIQEGSAILEVEGKAAQTLEAGERFSTVAGEVHKVKNASNSTPAKDLAFYIAKKGARLEDLAVPSKWQPQLVRVQLVPIHQPQGAGRRSSNENGGDLARNPLGAADGHRRTAWSSDPSDRERGGMGEAHHHRARQGGHVPSEAANISVPTRGQGSDLVRGCPRLAAKTLKAKTLKRLQIAGQIFRNEVQSDVATELEVVCLIRHTHAPHRSCGPCDKWETACLQVGATWSSAGMLRRILARVNQ